MATLYAPIAPPASGKSHLVDRWVRDDLLLPEAVICPDHLRLVFTGDLADQSANREVFETANRMTAWRLSKGFDVFYDATNLLPSSRDDLAGIAGEVGADLVWIRLSSDTESGCRARNEERRQPVPDEVMRVMFERYAQVDWDALPGTVMTAHEATTRRYAQRPSRASVAAATVGSMK